MITMPHNDHHSSGSLSKGVAFLGEHCDRIHALTVRLASALSPLSVGYLDALHGHQEKCEMGSLTTSAGGAVWQLPSHQDHWNLSLIQTLNDLVLINGNHHSGAHQILICNPEKTDSVLRRRENIGNVILILLTDTCQEVPAAFMELPNAINAHCLHVNDVQGIASFLRTYFFQLSPALLILAGGKSTRMGKDKSMIEYHGMPQIDYLTSIATQLGMESFISVSDGSHSIPASAIAITDVFNHMGPLGGICSAHHHSPQRSWLVVACDMPLVDAAIISELSSTASEMHDVVCYKSPHSNLPEPLLSFWTPRALRFAWHCIANGIRCPRKVIMLMNALLLECGCPDKLANANTPEDLARLRRVVSGN